MWFIPSEPLRTTLLDTLTIGEGVLQVFGVVRSLSQGFDNKSRVNQVSDQHIKNVLRGSIINQG